jgi:hypothetical protein
VGAENDEDDEHGPEGRSTAYEPPATGTQGAGHRRVGSFAAGMPSQADELQEISALSKDASEILWEMVTIGQKGPEVDELRERAEMLRAQLRGLINDYQGGDETLLAGALESFEMLNQCLDENPAQPPAQAAAPRTLPPPPMTQAPPAAAPAAAPEASPAPEPAAAQTAADVPLISLD